MNAPRIRKVMMTTDLSEESWSALAFARDLAERYSAKLCLCSVVEEPPAYLAVNEANAVDPRLQSYLEDSAADTRSKIAARLAEEHLEAEVTVTRSLDPPTTILEQARVVGADLIVMATHGRTGIKRFLLGSVAEKILRSARVPVLTVQATSVALPA